VERPEIEWLEFDQYARMLEAARKEGVFWHLAVCRAGEAGMRIGEVRALRWERHVDLVAGMIAVAEQMRKGVTGSPKAAPGAWCRSIRSWIARCAASRWSGAVTSSATGTARR
jgi:hypothetical protein